MTPSSVSSGLRSTVVTVTYGKRWALLRQALASARAEGFTRAVVVDNGAEEDIASMARDEFGLDFVDVVQLGRNTGSAGGFKAGIERACVLGTDLLLLLDDDNILEAGCASALSAAWEQHASTSASDSLAVLAYRADRLREAATLVPANGTENKPSAFLGFSWADAPFKVFRRTPWGRKWLMSLPVQQEVKVAFAPYSGMFFHRDVISVHGLPDERFVLYADDTEFSYRITRAGGKIVLVTEAKITDLEPSWSTKGRFGNQFDALLRGEDDFRAFYSARNNAYYERWSRGQGQSWVRRLNRLIFLAVLSMRARSLRARERYALLRRAISEGEAGRLGVSDSFPLK
jgi:GT2 family glycosyltransferase